MRYIFLVFVSLFFMACSGTKPIIKEKKEIADLALFPQDIEFYIQNLQDDEKLTNKQREERYIRYYFNVWNNKKPRENKESTLWAFNAYTAKNGFGENLQPYDEEFFIRMKDNSNIDSYGEVSKKAITLGYTNLRVFPTNKPLFKDPTKAGEGFPFDYLQNSSIAPNKPLFISHYSKDKKWVYVFSSFASGWILSTQMVILEDEHTETIQKAELLFFTKENFAVQDKDNNFLFRSRIGMNLPIVNEEDEYYTALAISSFKNATPQFLEVKIPKTVAQKNVLSFTKENIINIIREVSISKYGWGGLYEERDCSSMLRDIYAPFGVWLPRNSLTQSRVGDILPLENLTNIEKINIIKEKAVPFKTLLYKQGHIVLYLGTFNDEIVVLHNYWGIRTKDENNYGRIVIGKTIISTLEIGKEQEFYNEEEGLLQGLKSLNILSL